jgi:hypothetical protein
MNGISQVLKQAWQISQSSEVKKEERLAALSLAITATSLSWI